MTRSPSGKERGECCRPRRNDGGMRLAYADPPYPGKAHLYPENAEVDHAALIARLGEYDGWALSTDEPNLRLVLGLCPPRVRVMAWCITNPPPLLPYPIRSWEPVILSPARVANVDPVRTFLRSSAPTGFSRRFEGLTGQKPRDFCEWVVRALGAQDGDSLEDFFPGSGIMGETFASVMAQPSLFKPNGHASNAALAQLARKALEPLPGMPPAPVIAKVRNERRAAPGETEQTP